MENGQEETKTESTNDTTAIKEVKEDKPASEAEDEAETKTAEEPSSELLEKIKNQVEFYFGNVNMQRDKFLIQQVELDDGWVPMSVMLNFKMLAAMSSDADVILKALESSELMEVSEDKKKIRRSPKHPLPEYNEEYRKAQEARTAYIKGFPLTGTTIEKLKSFFTAYEPFENIIMRKYLDKDKKFQFKGSIFIQFKTLEDAKAFMDRESIKYGDTELIRKWSADYTVSKLKEREETRQKRAEKKAKGDDSAKGKDDGDSDDEKDHGLPKGSVIHMSGMTDKCSREDIKERLGELEGCVAFVDFKKGDTEGWVRLQGENSAKPVLEKMKDNKVVLNDAEVTCRILEGEEEEKYLMKAKEEMANTRQKFNKPKRGGRRGGRNFQRGGRKRRNSPTRDEVPAKKQAAE